MDTLSYIRQVRSSFLACALAVFPTVSAAGQACPNHSETGPSGQSEVRTLEGQLVFHDGLRKWFELRLDGLQCGEASIQLVRGDRAWTPMEILRGCRVRSRGALNFSPTGYFSLNVYQDVQMIESVGKCERQSPFPDYSEAKPDKAVGAYRVDMRVDYEPGDHPVMVRVTSAGKELRPWQAYASYILTGGFVFYGFCADGYVIDKVFGSPEARPNHFDDLGSSGDMAMFDPESAAAAGKKRLELGYTCARNRGRLSSSSPQPPHPPPPSESRPTLR